MSKRFKSLVDRANITFRGSIKNLKYRAWSVFHVSESARSLKSPSLRCKTSCHPILSALFFVKNSLKPRHQWEINNCFYNNYRFLFLFSHCTTTARHHANKGYSHSDMHQFSCIIPHHQLSFHSIEYSANVSVPLGINSLKSSMIMSRGYQ